MNVKRWLVASIIVFIVFFVLDWLFHGVCLMGLYEMTSHLWRAPEEMNMWLMGLSTLIWAFLFCYIYTKGYEAKPSRWAEGLRYGLFLGLLVMIPMSLSTYAVMPIPGRLAFGWFITGIFEYLLSGVIVGLIYTKPETAA